MAERFVSPGVFTSENDISFIPQGIAEIGAAIIGPTAKGPAFRPTIVQSRAEFEKIFGAPDSYTGYTAHSYLQHADSATIVRVLGLDGYNPTTYGSFYLTISGSNGEYVAAIVHQTIRNQGDVTASISNPTGSNFLLTVSGTTQSQILSCSLDPTSVNYLPNVLGTGPNGKSDGYVYAMFPRAVSLVGNVTGTVNVYEAAPKFSLSGSIYGKYSNADTPWIQSQTIGGQKFNLFKFHTLTDGDAANTNVKVSISAIKAAPNDTIKYGTFRVSVRDFSDTDSAATELEGWNVNLNPDSPDYIARIIGDSVPLVDENGNVIASGDYPNTSRYIYVEMTTGIETLPTSILPFGFAALNPPLATSTVPSCSYVNTRYAIPAGGTTPVSSDRTYYGFDFNDDTNLSYLNPLPSGSEVITTGAAFSLENLATTDGIETTGSLLINEKYRKFTIPFQGGFDGINPAAFRATGTDIVATNLFGYDLSDSSTGGSRAYALALSTISNPQSLDVNMLFMPGVLYNKHSYIASKGISTCEDRGDAFYVMDAASADTTVAGVVSAVSEIDSNYVAVYHPWVKITNVNNGKLEWVPPSVVMAGVFSYNDKYGAEWFAPAGLNRGVLEAKAVRTILDKANRDTLYDGRVNPIANFPGTGITAWGQKTLQIRASALDRINVRRLLITAKKAIASFARYLVFEPNTDATRQRFLNMANPYLQSIQERQGLYAFEVKMDSENNTPDLIDRNILVGQIWLQPVRASEFISLEFNVMATGATFHE